MCMWTRWYAAHERHVAVPAAVDDAFERPVLPVLSPPPGLQVMYDELSLRMTPDDVP